MWSTCSALILRLEKKKSHKCNDERLSQSFQRLTKMVVVVEMHRPMRIETGVASVPANQISSKYRRRIIIVFFFSLSLSLLIYAHRSTLVNRKLNFEENAEHAWRCDARSGRFHLGHSKL